MQKENREVIIGDRLKNLQTIVDERVEWLHELNGTSKEDLNKLFGKEKLLADDKMKESTYNNYIYNNRKPPIESLKLIAAAFNTSTDYIIGHSDYVLDTWGPEFIEELLRYSQEKLRDHLDKRCKDFSHEIQDEKYLSFIYLVLKSGLVEANLEDLTEHDREYLSKSNHELSILLKNVSKLLLARNMSEMKAMNSQLELVLSKESSFKKLDTVSGEMNLTREDKIVYVKNLIEKNNRENNKAIRMLNELLEE